MQLERMHKGRRMRQERIVGVRAELLKYFKFISSAVGNLCQPGGELETVLQLSRRGRITGQE